jgi:serine/threonine protein kinase
MISDIISHYTIIEELGRGGMAVVYKAFDTKLERQVAIKVLRPETIGDPVSKKRFLREARAASLLNHPNITTIYEIDERHGYDFIVMEYVEGQTIKGIIQSEKSNAKHAIEYAIQIADALVEAHEHHIIHRDIKSENIMITPKGQVKVMDFGLAKIEGTVTKTEMGMTPGTIAYMSPEQTRGDPLDFRTDIWSFGVVLYEMVTGQLPFRGDYEQAVIYSILHDEPEPVQNYCSDLSQDFLHILDKTLQKNCKDRYQSAQDMLVDFRRLKRDSEKDISAEKKSRARSRNRDKIKKKKARIAVGGLAFFCIIALIILVFNPFAKEHAQLAETIPFSSLLGDEQRPAFSPDGTRIAFMWNGETQDNWDIYVKELGVGGAPTRLTNHQERDYNPVWSPDGKSIVFGRRHEGKDDLYIISALGKAEQKLCDTNWRTIRCFDWSKDGLHLAVSAREPDQNKDRIYMLNFKTFEKTVLTYPDSNVLGDRECAISPDCKKAAFVRLKNLYNGDIYVKSISGGDPVKITHHNSWIRGLAWTKNGKEIVYSSNHTGNNSLWRIRLADRRVTQVAASRFDLAYPTVSRQGSQIAYEEFNWNLDVYRIDLSQKVKSPTRFISSTRPDVMARFSKDGKKIAFSSMRSGPLDLWICDNDGANPTRIASFNGPWTGGARWSPDGQTIVFDVRLEGYLDIFIIDAQGGESRRLTASPSDDCNAYWSPDGKSIYFQSDRNGNIQIWKMLKDGSEQIQVTENGGWSPQISSDGKWLYYLNNSGAWRRAIESGYEEQIFDFWLDWLEWAVCDNGIYFVQSQNRVNNIKFFEFKTKQILSIIDNLRPEWLVAFDISQDGRWLVYSQQDPSVGDIILIENFR